MILQIASMIIQVVLGIVIAFGSLAIAASILLNLWDYVKNFNISDDAKCNLTIAAIVLSVIFGIVGFVSFCMAYDEDRSEYNIHNSCKYPTRLNRIDPFHKLGCYLGEVPEEK